MAFASVLIRLLLFIIVSATASTSSPLARRVSVEAHGRFQSDRATSNDLEAKQTDLRSSGESSTVARRDLLWQAVRDVDDQFRQTSNCKLEERTTYTKESMLLAGQTSYSKTNIASARECALMCAADSLDDRNHRNLSCKSFTFNKTANECKFFNFGQQARDTWNNNACCTSGPPCNLDSMREEIQSHFHAELKRMMLSHKRLATMEKHTVPNIKEKVAKPFSKHTVPNVERKVATRPERVQKAEQKGAGPVTKHTMPNVKQKVATQPVRAVAKVERKVETLAEHAVPKFEQKVGIGVGVEDKLHGPVVPKRQSLDLHPMHSKKGRIDAVNFADHVVEMGQASSFHLNDTPNALHHQEGASLHTICTLCVCMYGTIGCLWIVFWSVAVTDKKELIRVALLCITWCSTSVGMTVLNKSLAVTLGAPIFISMLQMVIALLVVVPMSIQSFSRADVRQMRTWLIVPVCFAGMLCTSFYTFSFISISLFTVIRNVAPLIVLPIERLIMPVDSQPHIGVGIILSILTMLVGAIIYAGGVPELSMVGVAFALLNMILAVTDRLIQRRLLTSECKDLPSNVCTVMNNLFGMFPLMALAAGTGQLKAIDASVAAKWLEPYTCILLVLSALVGIGICYIGFECQRAISATSFFVLGNLSKVFTVTAGIVIFHDHVKSTASILGLILSLSGSVLYGKIQLDTAEEKRLKKLQS